MTRGYFGVGIFHTKTPVNIGTLLRSATLYDAAFVFTVGARYKRQSSDTLHTPSHTPLFHFADIDDLRAHLPWSAPLVGVELDPSAVPLNSYPHPERAVYLLGAEDHGLPPNVVDQCHSLIQIPSALPQSLNVAVAGSLVMYDRHVRGTAARRLSAVTQQQGVAS